VRGAILEAVDAGGTVLATDTLDNSGAYDVTVDAGTDVRIRVRSQLQNTTGATWNIQVLDNTSSNAIYILNGTLTSSGTADSTRNLNAGSGWGGSSYTGTRAAAPFAILDSMYDAIQDIAAVDTDVVFPDLQVFWSTQNRAASGDIANGEIGTSSYTRIGGVPTILILGDENNDTDEYDSHVIVHEFGHYFEDQLSRSESTGGPHSLSQRLDPRLAFGEGWGNAFSGMILGDPNYRDSGGTAQAAGFTFSVENNTATNQGWFNEASIQSILYDIFDSTNDGPDTISAGLAPIYEAYTNASYLASGDFTTIFSFASQIRTDTRVSGTVLDNLLTAQGISGTGPRGTGETNDGGRSQVLPIYKTATIGGGAVTVCSSAVNGTTNKLGVRDFITLSVPTSGTYTLTATKTSGAATTTDPDFFIWEQGSLFTNKVARSSVIDSETWTGTLNAGVTYAIEIFDTNNFESASAADSCFAFSAS
jgi:hypothetical protein